MKKLRIGDIKSLSIASFFILFSAALGGASLYALKFITDSAVAKDLDKLFDISKVLLFVIILELIFNLIKTHYLSVYVKSSTKTLKEGYVAQMFSLSLSDSSKNYDKRLSHLSNDIDRYEEKYFLKLIQLLQTSASLLVSLIILASINSILLLIALVLLVFFVIISKKASKPIVKKEEIKSKSLQAYTNYVVESLKGFYVIKQSGLEKTRLKSFSTLAKKVQEDNYQVDKKSTNIDAFNQFLQFTVIFSLIFIGIYFAIKNNLSLGTTLLAGTAFSNSIWPMQEITPYISQMTGVTGIIEEFDRSLKNNKKEKSKKIKNIDCIRFKNADLGYKKKVILKNVNLKVLENEKVLILGRSGVGKSTILKSIQNKIKPIRGSIEINNENLNQINEKSYFKEISLVDQVGFIFNASIKDNICLYQKVDIDKLKNILSTVGLDSLSLDFVLKNDGKNISGGQRARILLARAIFLNTSVIICDEIFANLDEKIAISIEKSLLSVNKTVINVSHIVFDENINMYDTIYLVKENSVKKINNTERLNSIKQIN